MVDINNLKSFQHTFTFSPIAVAISAAQLAEGKTLEALIAEATTEVKKLGDHVQVEVSKNRKGEITGIRRKPETYTLPYPSMGALGITGTIEASVFESMLQETLAGVLSKQVKEGVIPEFTWETLLTKLQEYYADSDSSGDGLGRKLLTRIIDSFTAWRDKNKKDANGTKLITNAIRKKFDYDSTFRLRQNLDVIVQGILTWLTEAEEKDQADFADAVDKLAELAEKAKTLPAPIEPTENMFG